MTRPTLTDVVDEPGRLSAAELLDAHAEQLAAVIDAVGVGPAAEVTELAEETVAAVATGDRNAAGDLDLAAAAAILSLADGAPTAEDIVTQALDDLLFGMTAGVLNVDVVAGELAVDLEPREVQGVLEGRHPATLREFVALQQVIAGRSR